MEYFFFVKSPVRFDAISRAAFTGVLRLILDRKTRQIFLGENEDFADLKRGIGWGGVPLDFLD